MQHERSPFNNTAGFAYCVSGHVKVPVSAVNEKLLSPEPVGQYAVTISFVHFLQANSSRAAEINGGSATISQIFNIQANLCYPKNAESASTIQFLIHGIGFNQSYWNLQRETLSLTLLPKQDMSDHPVPNTSRSNLFAGRDCTHFHHFRS